METFIHKFLRLWEYVMTSWRVRIKISIINRPYSQFLEIRHFNKTPLSKAIVC